MDPCPFVRLTIDSLLLKLPSITRSMNLTGIHPTTTPCFCTLSLLDLSPSLSKSSPLPLSSPLNPDVSPSCPSISFILEPTMLQKLSSRPAELAISVFTGRQSSGTCGLAPARAIGRIRVNIDVQKAVSQTLVACNGWVNLGGHGAQLHMVVRAEPDPRFVFQFGGEPECSPVVFQIQGNWAGSGRSGCAMQPVFSCRFNLDRRRSTRSRSLPRQDHSTKSKLQSYLTSFKQGDISPHALRAHQNQRPRSDQRKGWTVTIHDLSGSPVAAASMVTPFVPSPGSGRVSRSNPGAWLILRPDQSCHSTWHPWARLEAWRERRPSDSLGLRFELTEPNLSGAPIAELTLGVKKGGKFVIESRSGSVCGELGFVMGSTVEGEGKVSKPTVQIGVRHVASMADVALLIALSAAVDLSMDACRLFSQKLRKELCVDQEDYIF
ncbi:hypothetical protein LUZ60_008372 [Juncus effusus]|nr:hypothetical protein LUZ60_008372 [Juncus effusus]